jgi:hypothetical protein
MALADPREDVTLEKSQDSIAVTLRPVCGVNFARVYERLDTTLKGPLHCLCLHYYHWSRRSGF